MVILQRPDFGFLAEDRLDALDRGLRSRDRGDDVDSVRYREGPDAPFVGFRPFAGRRIDDEVDLLVDDEVDRVGTSLGDLVNRAAFDAVSLEKLRGSARGDQVEPQ